MPGRELCCCHHPWMYHRPWLSSTTASMLLSPAFAQWLSVPDILPKAAVPDVRGLVAAASAASRLTNSILAAPTSVVLLCPQEDCRHCWHCSVTIPLLSLLFLQYPGHGQVPRCCARWHSDHLYISLPGKCRLCRQWDGHNMSPECNEKQWAIGQNNRSTLGFTFLRCSD